jgi:hypothetical protein
MAVDIHKKYKRKRLYENQIDKDALLELDRLSEEDMAVFYSEFPFLDPYKSSN